MIFLHNEIDLVQLTIDNFDLKKVKNSLDSNIIYVEFKKYDGEYKTKFVNLTKDVFNEEFKTFDLNKFNENILLANEFFLDDLKTNINMLSESSANNSSELLQYLNKSTFFGSSFYLSKEQIGNASIGGAHGYGTVNFLLSYIKSLPNDQTLEEFSSNRFYKIKNTLKKYNQNDEKLIFAKNLIENIELFNDSIENIELLNLNKLFENDKIIFDYSKPTIFIWNIDGIRNKYVIKNEVNNIKNYFNNIVFNDILNLKNISCKCCLRKDFELNSNEEMTKYSEFVNIANTKIVSKFNLENKEENDFSLIVCSTCKEKIRENNDLLDKYKFILLKESIGYNSEVEVIKNSYYKHASEILNSNDFGYLYKINKIDNIYNFSYEFSFKSNNNLSIEEIKQNYLTINRFLGRLYDLQEKHQYIGKYSFLTNHYAEESILEIDKYFNHYMDYYLNGKKLNLNIYISLLNELYLKNILNGTLNMKFFKENYFKLLIKLTKLGEENMNIKEIVNSKLKNFELENKTLDFTDKELVVLSGRILSYLNSKSKESDKTLNYLANIKNYNVKNLKRILLLTFKKYSASIGDNQIKLKTIFSHLLTEFDKVKLNNLEIESLFLIGALAGKDEIELTKIKIGE